MQARFGGVIGGRLGAGLLLLCLLAGGGLRSTIASQVSPSGNVNDIRAAIRTVLDVQERVRIAGPTTELAAERDRMTLYAATNDAPVWTESGRPTDAARTAIGLLRASAENGLDPDDYDADALTAMAVAMPIAPAQAAAGAALFDTTLSLNVLRYMRELHLGRVDPRSLGLRIVLPTRDDDFPSALLGARSVGGLRDYLGALAPRLPQYAALKRVLAEYRSLASDGGARVSSAGASIHPGDHDARVVALIHALIRFGDLPRDARPVDDDLYAGTVVDGVRRFQARHGLAADGVVGRETVDAIDVPVSWRIRQIELAMERLRWLPDPPSTRLVVVNIPMFRLWAWDDGAAGRPVLSMSVIVGRAVRTRTPVFADEMRYVIFRPYWDVPRSIVRSEILPIVARDPAYLEREDMEIVRSASDQAGPVAPSADALDQLRAGALRLRQRPGPNNALGLVKFVFPNDLNIYMHGTPAQNLFSQARRDFSHGCIRVEDPMALATWVLRGQQAWPADAIRSAMNGEGPVRVDLPAAIRVLIFYTTAVVVPEDGLVHFARDIYEEDSRLDAALLGRAGPDARGTSRPGGVLGPLAQFRN